jgi:hypothetical protein
MFFSLEKICQKGHVKKLGMLPLPFIKLTVDRQHLDPDPATQMNADPC